METWQTFDFNQNFYWEHLLRYVRFEVGDTVHRVGEMVQQAGDMYSSIEN